DMKNVPVNTQVQATFSYSVDPVTVTKNTFIVNGPQGTVAGSVTYQDPTATFTPAAPFAKGNRYDVILTTGIKDLDGIPLPSNVTWSFVTEGDPAPAGPTITSTTPADAATGVAPNAPIMATFSKPMNAATINANTFIVSAVSSGAVAGTIDYREETMTAIFVPSKFLNSSADYSVTVTTAVQDQSGVPLAQEKKWSFKTGGSGAVDTTPPSITGKAPDDGADDVSLNSSITVSFNEAIDFETLKPRFILTGPQGAVDAVLSYSGGTATLTPKAPLAENTSYQAVVKKGVADISGNAMAADTTWGFKTGIIPDTTPPTIVQNLPTGDQVPVKSLITIQFSEPMNADSITKGFNLSRPGRPSVPGDFSYDAGSMTATFDPTGIRLQYGMTYTVVLSGVTDLAGNPLAEPRSWSFTTVADPPQVGDHAPTGEIPSTLPTIQASFSKPMDPSTINPDTFKVVPGQGGGTSIAGAISYSYDPADPAHPIGAAFTPSAALQPGGAYQVTLTASVEDAGGNPLESDFVWTFSVAPAAPPPDLTPPAIVAIQPLENAASVSVQAPVQVVFSESINQATLNDQTFFIGGVTAVVTYDDSIHTARLTPPLPLAFSTTYSVTVTRGVQDLAGNPLASDRRWSFTTESDPNAVPPDTTPPSVVSTSPAKGATGVPTGFFSPTPIQIVFSEAIRSDSINNGTFKVERVESGGSGGDGKPQLQPVQGSYQVNPMTATFFSGERLNPGTTYVVTLTTGVQDLAGNHLSSDDVWSFTTAP
ncbi:MAG TPA: Ig-like domain-containing protein, partial [Candidatus Manganitrophaceae bacterium]|nr:Ig-like domain-containing protein [Candidatus Manganitrophaceae bacterium]